MFIQENDIVTFKRYLKVSFTFDVKNKFVGLQEAEQDYVKPILGNTLYDSLQASVNQPTATPVQIALLDQCRKVTVPLSILNNLSTISFNISDAGIKKNTVREGESVYRWEFEKLEADLKNKVAKAIDDLWKFLFDNASTLSWQNPSPYRTIFKTSTQFANVYPLFEPHRIFNMFLPIVNKVETLYIYDAVGEAFYKELIAETSPSDQEKKAIELLQCAVAHYTILNSVNDLAIKITDYGLTVLYNNAVDAPNVGQAAATESQLAALKRSREADATRYLNRAIKYLNETASNSLFATYYNSAFYTNPSTKKTDYNSTRKGIVAL